ncbi:hypothetical protein X474_02075 [Dethiosulfatarculus sandiegensis]|uniref:Uncharacterized protein n=1 Tax=Dethiosulfatarculus sandiegensis TaxID=1429043 RepID=A0A0D2JJ19_9BACT|nr:hypothetical protein X474_02075 [Dethiosulfatarculus sandiegensis]
MNWPHWGGRALGKPLKKRPPGPDRTWPERPQKAIFFMWPKPARFQGQGKLKTKGSVYGRNKIGLFLQKPSVFPKPLSLFLA